MNILITILIGLFAGIAAKLLMPGKDPGGFIVTTLLGVAGSVLATWLGQEIGWYDLGERAGFIGAVLGAMAILLVYRLLAGRRRG